MASNEALGARIKFAKYDNAHEARNEKPEFTAAEIAAIGLELLWLSSCWLYSDDGRDLEDFEDAVRNWRNSKLNVERNEKPYWSEESHMLRTLGAVGYERE